MFRRNFVWRVDFDSCMIIAQRAFACGGAGLLGFVFFILLVAEKDSRYVEDKSDHLQVREVSCGQLLSVIFVQL